MLKEPSFRASLIHVPVHLSVSPFTILPLNLLSSYNRTCLDFESHQREKPFSETNSSKSEKGKLQGADNLKIRGGLRLGTGQLEGPRRYSGTTTTTTTKGQWTQGKQKYTPMSSTARTKPLARK